MAQKKSILIILIAGIGDFVLASKSIRAIRNGFPNADVHLLTSTEAATIAQNSSFIDRVWIFPIREMRKNKLSIFNMLKIALNLRRVDYDVVLNLYMIGSWFGAFKMGLLLFLVGGRVKAGHNHKGFGLFLNRKAPEETFQNHHFADAMMDIALLAGGKSDNLGLDISYDESCEEKWRYLFPGKTSKRQDLIIGINPGGDRQNRRWKPDHFAFVASYLKEHYKANIILLGGPGEESIAHYIQTKMTNDLINLAGKLTVNDLTYIISRLDLLVTNDSGPMHIAAAAKTPLVAIFGPENPVLMRPYTKTDLYRIAYKDDIDCRPCVKKNCSQPICLDLITTDEVIEKCSELIRTITPGEKTSML